MTQLDAHVEGHKKTDAPYGRLLRRVTDGTRTRDVLDHNQVLYQLNYGHQL